MFKKSWSMIMMISFLRNFHSYTPRVWSPMHGIYFCKVTSQCASCAHLYSSDWVDIGGSMCKCGICCCFSGFLESKKGPLELADFIGLDVCTSILLALQEQTMNSKYKPAPLLLSLVNQGRLGKKVQKGFYEKY